MDEKNQEIHLLTEYFKSLREEIHIRIKEHTRLVWIKIVSLGLIISFLTERFYTGGASLGGESSTSYLFHIVWIIPLAAVIFDILIAGNLRDINNLGHYIKEYFEGKFFRKYVGVPEFSFWEEVAGQGIPEYRCYTKRDMMAIWLFTFASWGFSGLSRWQFGFTWVDAILALLCLAGVIVALRCLIRSITMKRMLFHIEIGGVPNIGWKWDKGIMESEPSLRTAGYNFNLLYIPPNIKHKLKGGEFIVCLLRGSVMSEKHLSLRKSLLLHEDFRVESGENGCLLFVCRDEGDNKKYKDDILGMRIEWSEYDSNMYRTRPQIHVDKYRINLWYLGPNKHGGIHNHSHEPIPFVEFHTQLRGNGWMVKYKDEDGKNEIERVKMTRGDTHNLFCDIKDNRAVYPWHEYIADEKGSLFLVFEDTKAL